MKVSVITPTYNRAELLPRVVRGIQEQTHNAIEHIIVDDGSTDNTRFLLDRLSHPHTRVQLNSNQGVSTARNAGISEATGDAILFVDADDELPPQAITTLSDMLQSASERCAGVFGQQLRVRETSTSKSDWPGGTVGLDQLRVRNCMGAIGGKLIRSHVFDAVGGFDERFPSSEDFDFFMRVAKVGHIFLGCNEVTYRKHEGPDRLSAASQELIEGHLKIITKYEDELTPRHRASRWYTVGRTSAAKGQLHMARRCFWNAVRLQPRNPRYVIAYTASRVGVFNHLVRVKGAL